MTIREKQMYSNITNLSLQNNARLFKLYLQYSRVFIKWFFTFLTIIMLFLSDKSLAVVSDKNVQQIFSLGRSVGASYYHLIDLCDKTKKLPYSSIKNEYHETFQSLNITDIILEDIEISNNSMIISDIVRSNYFNSLKDQDLNSTLMFQTKDIFVSFYESVAADIQTKFSSEGSWIFALGFYSSFQMESLSSSSKSKLLISGFHKILSSNPIKLPEKVKCNLKIIDNLDKNVLSFAEIDILNKNIIELTDYFDNYPKKLSPDANAGLLAGNWQGILIDPENQRHKIKLTVNTNKSITMDIDGIAQTIVVSDINIVNNYFTFMFKPFGTEKLYIKFGAKIHDGIFEGEVVDVLGQKGNWLLSKN